MTQRPHLTRGSPAFASSAVGFDDLVARQLLLPHCSPWPSCGASLLAGACTAAGHTVSRAAVHASNYCFRSAPKIRLATSSDAVFGESSIVARVLWPICKVDTQFPRPTRGRAGNFGNLGNMSGCAGRVDSQTSDRLRSGSAAENLSVSFAHFVCVFRPAD